MLLGGLKGAVRYGSLVNGVNEMSNDERSESFGKPGDASTAARRPRSAASRATVADRGFRGVVTIYTLTNEEPEPN